MMCNLIWRILLKIYLQLKGRKCYFKSIEKGKKNTYIVFPIKDWQVKIILIVAYIMWIIDKQKNDLYALL